MRLLSLIATMVATAAIAIYAMTCSVNNVPPAPVHPIVGKWQLVRIGNNFSVGMYPSTTEFTRDGKLISKTTKWKQGDLIGTGTYIITNDQVCTTHHSQPFTEDGDFYCKIALLDSERLILKTLDDDITNESEYIRVRN